MSEKDRRDLDQARRDIAEAKRLAAANLAREKRASIDHALDEAVIAGRLLPAQRDKRRRVLLTLSTNRVHKFSEKGKTVEKSQLDLALDELRTGPVLLKFSERVKSAGKGQGHDDGDGEVAAARALYQENVEKFSEFGQTEDDFIAGFEHKRKLRGPGYTAEEYRQGK